MSNALPINKWIWARGSSGVIANNAMDRADSPDGSSYPNKPEIFLLTVGCPNPYPMQFQVGQSSETPESPPTHPLAIFGNTGAGTRDGDFISVAGSDTAGPPCSTPNDYIQEGRDYVLTNTWGWTPYPYPHPLAGDGSGGAGGAGTGGSPGSGGANAGAGGASDPSTGSGDPMLGATDDDGCGCRLAGRASDRAPTAWLTLLALLALALRRRDERF